MIHMINSIHYMEVINPEKNLKIASFNLKVIYGSIYIREFNESIKLRLHT